MRWTILCGLFFACGGDSEPVDVPPADTDTDTDTDTYVAPPPDLEIEVPATFDFTHIIGPTECPQGLGTMVFTNHTDQVGSFEVTCAEIGGVRPFGFAKQQTVDYVPNLALDIDPMSSLTVNVVFTCDLLTTFESTFTVRAMAGEVSYEEVHTVFADIPTGAGG
jgi:hypothetical protein